MKRFTLILSLFAATLIFYGCGSNAEVEEVVDPDSTAIEGDVCSSSCSDGSVCARVCSTCTLAVVTDGPYVGTTQAIQGGCSASERVCVNPLAMQPTCFNASCNINCSDSPGSGELCSSNEEFDWYREGSDGYLGYRCTNLVSGSL